MNTMESHNRENDQLVPMVGLNLLLTVEPLEDDEEIKNENNGFLSVESRDIDDQLTESSLNLMIPSYKDDGDEVTLMFSKHEKIPMKDFGAEIRASMDVSRFLTKAVLLLDVTETSLERIVDIMLWKMLDSIHEPECSVAEAKTTLFTHNSGNLLSKTLQGICQREGGNGFEYDQSWIIALCNIPSLVQRHVAIARLRVPANMGHTCHEVRFFVLVLCPSKEKGTKNALETGRTFATLFADMNFRQCLLEADTEEEFKNVLLKHARELAEEQSNPEKRLMENHVHLRYQKNNRCSCVFGLRDDIARRLHHYLSDFKDGVVGRRTIHKLVSTTMFLYFACLLPSIAFGVLHDNNTDGQIDVQKVILGQSIGGLFFGFLGGQPLMILLTTAPLALYTKTIYDICGKFSLDFLATYSCVGLWNSFFLIVYSISGASRIMKWSTRSTEEIFAIFISIAFCVDAFRDVALNFRKNYSPCDDRSLSPSMEVTNGTFNNFTSAHGSAQEGSTCRRDSSLLFLLLMLGTLWLGTSLYNFNKTPYLQASKREALADYSLPVAVIVLTFIGSYVFGSVELEKFRYRDVPLFVVAPLDRLTTSAIFACMGMGFLLSLLFFMDQNITSAIVNNPCNKLKKGPAYHLDLFVVGLLNAFLSIFCLPWMHATLPHSPLHVRSLADVEERVDQGMVNEIIVRVRETRLTGILSHAMIGLSLFLLPYPLAYIPTAVLDGLFLYMAVTGLYGNQMFDRILLLFMEQSAYPPTHYIRRVPQRKIHVFTTCQVIQLAAMCVVGFSSILYLKTVFPFMILLLLPLRHKLIPLLIEKKFLEALDGEHQ
ncbi:hypothetical protein CHUAL_004579 [Chamberlinius hualienensis]